MKNRKFEYKHILPGRPGTSQAFVVKGYDRYPRHSVLAGQTRITFLDSFPTLEAAQEAHPTAKTSHAMLEPVNTFDHLDDTEGSW